MSTVTTYVQLRDGEYYVGESRVTLHSVVAAWRRGGSPEAAQSAFPSVPLATIYHAIAFYLEHREEMDAHFAETDRLLSEHQARMEAEHLAFFNDMRCRIEAYRAGTDGAPNRGESPS